MDLTDHANEPGIFTLLDVSARRAAGAHVSVGSIATEMDRLRHVGYSPHRYSNIALQYLRQCAELNPTAGEPESFHVGHHAPDFIQKVERPDYFSLSPQAVCLQGEVDQTSAPISDIDII